MDKDTEYEEITITIDDVDYTVDFFVHEYNDGELITKSSLDDWDKDFATKIKKECLEIGKDRSEEPEREGSYYYNARDYYDEDDYSSVDYY
jgi:hypothetical protein